MHIYLASQCRIPKPFIVRMTYNEYINRCVSIDINYFHYLFMISASHLK